MHLTITVNFTIALEFSKLLYMKSNSQPPEKLVCPYFFPSTFNWQIHVIFKKEK